MILVGDIGGTKTLLALFKVANSEYHILEEKKYASSDWLCLEDVIKDFLAWAAVDSDEITASCLSLAGPIQGDSCHLVNLNKTIDLARLRSSLNLRSPITFCNDLVATGHGIFTLNSSDLLCLNPENIIDTKQQPYKNKDKHTDKYTDRYNVQEHFLTRVVIAPGTGLGESIIIGGNVYPTEGAHVDFAPRSEIEIKLWRFLSKQFGHVSYERVLSGPGLVNIYRFLKMELPIYADLPELTPVEISQKALARSCPLSMKALDLFVEILGAEAGNLALKSLALGGIYLGGGIPSKILPKLKDGIFLNSFHDKGRFQELVKGIPVYVILNDRTALYGAARISSLKYNNRL